MNTGIHIYSDITNEKVRKGIYLVLLHANRIPPHIGLLIDNNYHSLSIKGHELNIGAEVLLKNVFLRKIPAVFIEIKKHPVFSTAHLSETFVEQIKLFDKVNTQGNTCLSPVKLFFDEFYALNKANVNLIFDLLEGLEKNKFIENAYGKNLGALKENIFYLQPYNQSDLQLQIEEEMIKLKK